MTSAYIPPPPTATITPYSLESMFIGLATPGSAIWPAANRAYFVPFKIYTPVTMVKMFVMNGVAVSGNFDIGIYDEAFTRLVSSGSTAQSGTTTLQVVDITDTLLGVGLFYMALVFDNNTAQVNRRNGPGFASLKGFGQFQQSTAFPLPTPATPASLTTSFLPLFGCTTEPIL